MSWLIQMEYVHDQTWKQWVIYGVIVISLVDMGYDMKLFFGFLDYWFLDSNAILFPWEMMTPTLPDMVATTK